MIPNLIYYVDCISLDPTGCLARCNAYCQFGRIHASLVVGWCYSSLISPKLIEFCFPLVVHNTIAFVGPLKVTMCRPTTFTWCIVWRCLVSLSCKTMWGFLSKDHYPSCKKDIQGVHGLFLYWRLSNFYTPTSTSVIRTIVMMVLVWIEHRPH